MLQEAVVSSQPTGPRALRVPALPACSAVACSLVGWRVSSSLHAELMLDALEMAIWRRQRQDLTCLIHHSDRSANDR